MGGMRTNGETGGCTDAGGPQPGGRTEMATEWNDCNLAEGNRRLVQEYIYIYIYIYMHIYGKIYKGNANDTEGATNTYLEEYAG